MSAKYNLLETWTQPGRGAYAGETLRLVSAIVDGYSGRARYIVERQERDSLGGERWSEVYTAVSDTDDVGVHLLLGLLTRIKEAKR